MKRIRITAVRAAVLGILLVGGAAPILAHHSISMFDLGKTITLQGTITEVAWGNPHSVFFADAKQVDVENSPVRNWSLEGPNPKTLLSKGLKPDTLKVGDKISVTGNPRKDGKPSLLLVNLTDASGNHYSMKEAS